MRTKLKEPSELSGMAESAYVMKLKTDMAALKANPKEEGPTPFIFRAGFAFSDDENTLFIAGVNSAWKKFIKEHKWLKTPESKKTLVGTCEINGDKIELTVAKGKLPKNLFEKAIKANRVLKQYEWVIVKEAPANEHEEDDDDDDGLNIGSNEAPEKTNEEDKAKATEIAKQLIAKVKILQQATDKAQKKQLILDIDKEAEALYAIPNWEAYTPDNLEAVLLKIENLLKEHHAEADSEADTDSTEADKEKAEGICKSMIELIKKIQQTADKTQKTTMISELNEFKNQLEAIPNWKNYTPDNLEKALAQLDAQEEKDEEKEEAIKAKEKAHFDTTNLKIETLYGAIAKQDFSNLSTLVGDIQSVLETWKTFENKVKEHPTLADALERQNSLSAALSSFETIAKVVQTVEKDLMDFQKAIANKDKVKALELQQKILTQLP